MVSDIKAESCQLTWDAPLDNGGSEITHYILEKRDASRKKSDWEEVSSIVVDRRYGVKFPFSPPPQFKIAWSFSEYFLFR